MPSVFIVVTNGNGQFVSIERAGEATIFQTGGTFMEILGMIKPSPIPPMAMAMGEIRRYQPTVFDIQGFIRRSNAISDDDKERFVSVLESQFNLFDTLSVVLQPAPNANQLDPFGAPVGDGVRVQVPFPFIVYIDP